MTIKQRLKAPTPKFWKKVGKVGVALTIIGGAIVTPLPVVGGILMTIGATTKSLSHLAVEDGSIND